MYCSPNTAASAGQYIVAARSAVSRLIDVYDGHACRDLVGWAVEPGVDQEVFQWVPVCPVVEEMVIFKR